LTLLRKFRCASGHELRRNASVQCVCFTGGADFADADHDVTQQVDANGLGSRRMSGVGTRSRVDRFAVIAVGTLAQVTLALAVTVHLRLR
jgi:hypothetical protein